MSRKSGELARDIDSLRFLLLAHDTPDFGERALYTLLMYMAQLGVAPNQLLDEGGERLRRDFGLNAKAADALYARLAQFLQGGPDPARGLLGLPLEALCVTGAAYPDRLLKRAAAPPPILYALGQVRLLRPPGDPAGGITFSLAVSNGADSEATNRLKEAAALLVAKGAVPVTGHDRPEYQAPALAAQRADRPTIFVLDRGLREGLGPGFDRPPFAAARIRDAAFRTDRDLAVSSFRLDDHCLGANNRKRDALVFALSDVVVAVDVRPNGAMISECRRVLEQDRPLYVMPGGREGNEQLRQAGAREWPEDFSLEDLVLPAG